MFNTLCHFVGRICYVYLDDIIIWLSIVEEHRCTVALILEALRKHLLFASPKKTHLFATELNFLGHHILLHGVSPDGKKVDKILDWPEPCSTSDVQAFLGLIRYLDKFCHGVESTCTKTRECQRRGVN